MDNKQVNDTVNKLIALYFVPALAILRAVRSRHSP